MYIYFNKLEKHNLSSDDLLNIVIPSNNLNKGFIRLVKLRTFFINLRTFFASKSQGGGPLPPLKPPLYIEAFY